MRYNLRTLLPAISAILISISLAIPAQAEEVAVNTGKIAADSNINATSDQGKVASVNGVIINQYLFNSAMSSYQQAYDAGILTAEGLTQYKTIVLENLISNELLYQESQKIGIKVDEKDINEAYDSRKAQFASEAEFLETLSQYKFTADEFKDQIRWGLSIQNFITAQFTVTDEETKKFYDDNPDYFNQIKASHILILSNPDDDQAKKDEAKKQIEDISKRLKSGEDFTALAKEVSQDTYTKENGGDLDYFFKGQMVQPFEDAAFALEVGETSNIVETDYGYHIIKLTGKNIISFDDAEEDIKSFLQNSKINNYVTELRSKATVEIFLTD